MTEYRNWSDDGLAILLRSSDPNSLSGQETFGSYGRERGEICVHVVLVLWYTCNRSWVLILYESVLY